MKSKDVIGKRIVGVRHLRWSNRGSPRTDCVEIQLEDGSRLVPYGFETIDCPAATILLIKKSHCRRKIRLSLKRRRRGK